MSEAPTTEFTFTNVVDIIDKISLLVLIAIMTIMKIYQTVTNKTYNTNILKMKEQKMVNSVPIVIEDRSNHTLANGIQPNNSPLGNPTSMHIGTIPPPSIPIRT